MQLPDIRSISVSGKTVILRGDLDVPLSEDKKRVEDSLRLRALLPTLSYLLDNNASVILIGHLGRPSEKETRFSLVPIAQWFGKTLGVEVKEENLKSREGWKIGESIFLLENIRFDKREEKNDPELSKELASLGDTYVNDAFAVCHRSHASIVGIPKFLPHFAGIHLQEEISILSSILKSPKRPLVIIIGGAKIETKLPLIEKMHHLADYVLVGGKIAQETKELLKLQHEKLKGIKSILLVSELNEDKTDITSVSLENFLQVLAVAQTIVWNGPLGKIDNGSVSEEGSKKIAQAIITSGAYSVVGGGDTLGFLKKQELLSQFSFVSVGGGAMLSFLTGETLLGIQALLL